MSTEEKARGLITARGLALRVGRTPNHVRNLMKWKGAPEPVQVEGGTEIVYETGAALAYLKRVMESK